MGLGYVFSKSAIPFVLFEANKVNRSAILSIEDVFITGILAKRFLLLFYF